MADALATTLAVGLGVHLFVHQGRGVVREFADDLFEYVFEASLIPNIAYSSTPMPWRRLSR